MRRASSPSRPGGLDYAGHCGGFSIMRRNSYSSRTGTSGQRLQNEFWSANNTGVIRHSDWNGKVIKLKKFVGNVEENAKLLGDLDRRLHYVAFFHRDCSWKQIPRMLVTLDQEKIQLAKTMGIPSDPGKEHRTIEYWEDSNPGYCGSIKDFLRSYMQ